MKLTPIAANITEVEIGDTLVLFSYKTPVACRIVGKGIFKTDKQWSTTTSRHINKWLRDEFHIDEDAIKKIPTMPQSELDELCA